MLLEGNSNGENASAIFKMPIGSELAKTCETIQNFVKGHRNSVSDDLQQVGRSRLARLVKQLPDIDDGYMSPASIQELAVASLPESRDALILTAASAAVYYLARDASERASHSADIALILLGKNNEIGAQLLHFIHLLQKNRMSTNKSHVNKLPIFGNSKLIGSSKLDIPTALTAVPCADVQASDLSTEQFNHEFFQKDIPVILRNVATHWPAFSKWRDLNSLSAKHGHRVVPVERVERAKQSGRMREEFQTLDEVFRTMALDVKEPNCAHDNEDSSNKKKGEVNENNERESLYLAQHPLFDYIPELLDDVRVPCFVEAGGKGPNADVINVWAGTMGSGSKLHFDSADNILVQVLGKKTVILIEPQYSSCLNIDPSVPNVSPIHPLKDEAEFPEFLKTVRGSTVQLNAGDGLFIPARHWHWVQADTCSISVNFWF